MMKSTVSHNKTTICPISQERLDRFPSPWLRSIRILKYVLTVPCMEQTVDFYFPPFRAPMHIPPAVGLAPLHR